MRKTIAPPRPSHSSNPFSRPRTAAAVLSILGWAGLGLATGAGAQDAAAEDPPKAAWVEALSGGKPTLVFRYRLESVDSDAFADDGLASTLRTVLGYRTGAWKGWSLYLEAENVTDLGAADLHNNAGAGSLANGVGGRPVIADPEATEVQQAYLRWQNDAWQVDLGRVELGLGDQRFVGPVGFRQNHQSFDGLSATWKVTDEATLRYLFFDNVNRIVGDNKPMASHLVDGTFDLSLLQLRAYGYLLDYDRATDAGLSTQTFGVEASGKITLPSSGRWDLGWEAERAQQQDTGDNPFDVDAFYRHLSLGLARPDWPSGLSFTLGWEVLEGADAGTASRPFSTPLATLHKFNGWADLFLATPIDGLEDLYLRISGKIPAASMAWTVRYHDFQAESTSRSLGTELDAQLTYKAPWGETFGLTAAHYDADEFAFDTTKIWLWSHWRL